MCHGHLREIIRSKTDAILSNYLIFFGNFVDADSWLEPDESSGTGLG